MNNVTKLAGVMEDLDVGINKVTQTRNGQTVVCNRVYIPVPVDSTVALAAIDPTKYLYAVLVMNGLPVHYAYDSTGTKIGYASTVAAGVWYPVNNTSRISVSFALQGAWTQTADNNFVAWQVGDLVTISGSLTKGAAGNVAVINLNGRPTVKTHLMAIGQTTTGYVPVECYVTTAGLLVIPDVSAITQTKVIINASYTV